MQVITCRLGVAILRSTAKFPGTADDIGSIACAASTHRGVHTGPTCASFVHQAKPLMECGVNKYELIKILIKK